MNLAASDPIERTVRRAGSESVETPATLETDTTVAELAADQILADLEAVKTNTSSRPYSSFSNGEKWFIVSCAAVAGTFSPISSNIYVPAIPLLAEKFDTTNEKINLTVTVYLIFQALTPAIWGSAADSFGRRPIYIVTMLVYVLSCVGSALCPTADYWLLMLMRILQATGGSALIAVGTGVVSDVAMPSERGKYLGLFNATSTFGPAIGPLLGGIFAYTLGWRSIFWFLVISGSVVLVPLIFFFPETLRSLVGDGSVPPPLLNCTPSALLRRRKEQQGVIDRGEEIEQVGLHRTKFKPWASFLLVFEPDLVMILFWASLYYALYYSILTLYSTLLQDKYGFNEIVIGTCYITSGTGSIISGLVTGRIMDRLYRKEKIRVGGDHKAFPSEFQLEKVRFWIFPFQAILFLATSIGIGWSLQERVHIAVPVVLMFFNGLGLGFLTTATVYGIDLFPGQGGAVTATFNLVRCIMGAVAVAVIQMINKVMGAGWTFVLISGICALGTPLPLIVLRYGPGWRLKRGQRIAKRVEEKKQKALV